MVGDFARNYYGKYSLVEYSTDKAKMVDQTRAFMDAGEENIAEASFIYDNLYCAVDILHKNGDGWDIVEVNSSTDVRDIYVEDVSYQNYVLKKCGINVKKVIIRTMGLSGVICGLLGFMLVCGVHQSFNATLLGGKGFTGVLIAWLGHFEPLEIALFSFLAAIFEQGTSNAASAINMSSAQFSAICTGIFFFIIIACEFFSRYQIKIHHKEKGEVAVNGISN
jgi:hypothetical protein